MMPLSRGEIYLVDFNPAKGGEIGKLRPAVVLSDEKSNAALATVIVVPLSTVVVSDALPYRLDIPKREKLRADSDACINEVRALSKHRVKEKIGRVSQEELAIISESLCKLIGYER